MGRGAFEGWCMPQLMALSCFNHFWGTFQHHWCGARLLFAGEALGISFPSLQGSIYCAIWKWQPWAQPYLAQPGALLALQNGSGSWGVAARILTSSRGGGGHSAAMLHSDTHTASWMSLCSFGGTPPASSPAALHPSCVWLGWLWWCLPPWLIQNCCEISLSPGGSRVAVSEGALHGSESSSVFLDASHRTPEHSFLKPTFMVLQDDGGLGQHPSHLVDDPCRKGCGDKLHSVIVQLQQLQDWQYPSLAEGVLGLVLSSLQDGRVAELVEAPHHITDLLPAVQIDGTAGLTSL